MKQVKNDLICAEFPDLNSQCVKLTIKIWWGWGGGGVGEGERRRQI